MLQSDLMQIIIRFKLDKKKAIKLQTITLVYETVEKKIDFCCPSKELGFLLYLSQSITSGCGGFVDFVYCLEKIPMEPIP